MMISLVAAVAENGVIGKNNDLPWRLPDDMKFFMEKTRGHHVILGRKNYDSLPLKYKPLPNRTNIVVTRQKDLEAADCIIVHTLEDALKHCRQNNEMETMVIGGADIYRLSLPYATRLYITEVKATIEGDVFFPDFDKHDWKEIARIPHTQDERHAHAFDFVTFDRIRGGKTF